MGQAGATLLPAHSWGKSHPKKCCQMMVAWWGVSVSSPNPSLAPIPPPAPCLSLPISGDFRGQSSRAAFSHQGGCSCWFRRWPVQAGRGQRRLWVTLRSTATADRTQVSGLGARREEIGSPRDRTSHGLFISLSPCHLSHFTLGTEAAM